MNHYVLIGKRSGYGQLYQRRILSAISSQGEVPVKMVQKVLAGKLECHSKRRMNRYVQGLKKS